MRTPAEHRRGIALMFGATLCWATAGVLVRNMEVTDGWKITFWRSFFMTVFMLLVLAYRHGSSIWKRIRATGWPGVVTGMLFAGMMISFILALSLTTVANTLVVGSISPFVAALCGYLFLGEKVAPRTWLAMVVAIGGIVIMFFDALSGTGWAGNLIALCIPIGFGANIVLLRKHRGEIDMMPSVLLAGIFSTLIALPFAMPLMVSAADLGLISVMGVLQLAIGLLLMMAAVPCLASAEIGLLSILEIVFGTLSVWIFIGERPSTAGLIGGGIVVGALVANQIASLPQARPTPD